MKAAVLMEKEKIEIQEIDIPEIGDHEILVKIRYCGICTLEQRLYSGAMKIYYPIIPGHEASGVVAAVGAGVVTPHRRGIMFLWIWSTDATPATIAAPAIPTFVRTGSRAAKRS